MKRYLIIGSAPSATLITPYLNKLNSYYDAVFAINNAWSLVKDIDFYWSVSTDFGTLGTIQPDTQLKRMVDYFGKSLIDGEELHKTYDPDNLIPYGTMYLNTLYYIINNTSPDTTIEIHVIGSDFDYSNDKTHFYGVGKTTKETDNSIKANAPELAGKAADPLRYGTHNLVTLLNKPVTHNIKIYSLSDNPNQLLPYERLNIHSLYN